MSLQDPSQFDAEKRFLLALLLSTAIVLASGYFLKFGGSKPAVEPRPPAVEQTDTSAESVPEAISSLPVEEETPVQEPPTTGSPRRIRVVGEDLGLEFDSSGAVIDSARLLKYSSRLVEGEALELIPQGLPETLPRPFSIATGNKSLDEELSKAVYEVKGAASDTLQAPAELTFEYRRGTLRVTRRVRVPAQGYLLDWETEVEVAGRAQSHSVVIGPGIGRIGYVKNGGFLSGSSVSNDFLNPGIAYFLDGSVTRLHPSNAESAKTIEGSMRWVAFDSQFFSYLVLAPGGLQKARVVEEKWKREEAGEEVTSDFIVADVTVSPGAAFSVFLGPKDLEVLKGTDATLGNLVDFGWLGVLVEPLLFVLKLIYGVVHNYGVAIILLTFLINLALVPIRYKQVVSMKKMGALQPKLKAIQERYKKLARDDPKRQDMNKEIMALYQEHGVNPLGGCLPLLIQMPFLFAFYRMLAGAIELRGAPFVLWIQDLSHYDPWYVTPVASGVMMLVQQQMTPATGDPMQRRMMMIMPLMLTYFFLKVSSGLALYFLFSTFFGILFQIGIQKMEKAPEAIPSSKPKRNSKKGKAN